MQAGLQDAAVKTPRKRACFCLVFAAIVFVPLATLVPAQSEVAETDLAAASSGRTIRLGAVADGRITTIPLEVYVARVLAGEADPRASDAAQQALAIAVRTYTLKNVDRHARDGYDLCDSTHCQVPRPSTPTSRRAAMATVGQVLTWQAELAEVFYSASCGGKSERAADVWPGANYPYLVSRPDDVCDDDPEWTLDLRLDDVRPIEGRRRRFENIVRARRAAAALRVAAECDCGRSVPPCGGCHETEKHGIHRRKAWRAAAVHGPRIRSRCRNVCDWRGAPGAARRNGGSDSGAVLPGSRADVTDRDRGAW